MTRAVAATLSAALLVGACSEHRNAPSEPARPPLVTAVAAAANPYNALSAVVTFAVEHADSARVVYRSDDDSAGATPYSAVVGGRATIVALGLRPATSYSLTVEALGGGVVVRSAAVGFAAGELPTELRALRLAGSGTSGDGYTLLTPIYLGGDSVGYVVAFDAEGSVRWYRAFAGEGRAVEAKQQPNGNFTVYLGGSYGWQPAPGRFVEIRPSGEVVGSFGGGAGRYTDPHELLLTGTGAAAEEAHFFDYEFRTFDLRALGGPADAVLAVHSIVRQTPGGLTQWRWSAADHFAPGDWPAANFAQVPDLDHPSSLEIDRRDGNYVVSFNSMDEITKIDAHTGEIIWRFGGRHNQFAIVGDALGGFQGQHSVRVLDDGRLLLLDNHPRMAVPPSRAVEYELDTRAMTARLVWEYRPAPPIPSVVMGSVQRLADGHTLVGFAIAGRVVEVDAAARALWDATLVRDGRTVPEQFYRALRIRSLYRSERP